MSTLRLYTKQALPIADQIALLKSRGLQIADESKATTFLGEVSYFRFVQYLRPMEADKITHLFKPNSRFEDAVALYEFDTELRNLMFRAIQRLEIALRTKICGVDGNKLYAITCCIAYWLDSLGYGVDFKDSLKALLSSYTQVDPAAMGFPANWKTEPLWR